MQKYIKENLISIIGIIITTSGFTTKDLLGNLKLLNMSYDKIWYIITSAYWVFCIFYFQHKNRKFQSEINELEQKRQSSNQRIEEDKSAIYKRIDLEKQDMLKQIRNERRENEAYFVFIETQLEKHPNYEQDKKTFINDYLLKKYGKID